MQSLPLFHVKVSLDAEMVLGWFTERIIIVLLGILGPRKLLELWRIELVTRVTKSCDMA